MLKNIKASYFLRLIFSHLEYAKKLKLIKTSKKFQNFFNVDVIHYRLYSGKIIYYDENSNQKGREYDIVHNNKLLYYGEYMHGEKNGKGTEYFSDSTVKFEGEYSKGKRNGRGKEYYKNKKLKFEGEFKNGKKITGKEYDFDGNFLHELNNNKMFIKEFDYAGRLMFEGDYENAERNGDGKDIKIY